MDLVKTLAELTAAFGPSGAEDGVAKVIEGLAWPHADEITRDVMGSLICRRKGNGPRVMFAAHMDSIGVVVTHIDEEGFAFFGAIGGLTPDWLVYAPVRFANGVRGVICPRHGQTDGKLKLTDLAIDLGAASRREAQERVQVGDPAVFDTRTQDAGGRVLSPYLDNRVGCLVLLMAMERLGRTDNDLYFVFTSQEEVGCRGAKTAAWAIDPDYGIAVDITGDDGEPGSKHQCSTVCGGGAAVKVMDKSALCHPWMVERLMALAAERGIPAQRDVMQLGGTDCGPIHQTRAGVYTGGISVPCRYGHAPVALADKADVEACAELVRAFAEDNLEKV